MNLMKIMKIKESFFKPTKLEVGIFVVLLILSSVTYSTNNAFGCSSDVIGFPYEFYFSGFSGVECPNPTQSYNFMNLIVNIVFWYIVSGFIIIAFKRLKANKKELRR